MRPARGDAEPDVLLRESGSTARAPGDFSCPLLPRRGFAAPPFLRPLRRAVFLIFFLTVSVAPSAFVRHLAPTISRPRIADFLTAAPLPPCRICRMLPRRSCCSCPAERPSLPSPQAGDILRNFRHEHAVHKAVPPAAGHPPATPGLLRRRLRRYAVASPRASRKRASQRLARARSRRAIRKSPPTRLPFSTSRHAAKSAAKSPQTTNSRPSALFPQHRRRAKKKGGIIPPSCHRFQRVAIHDCAAGTIRLCRATHAQSRADRTDADPPFFRRGPQR